MFGRNKDKEKGQSLLEVVIILGVTALVLGALIIAVIVGLKNSQFAQNQAKSTKYAQEALEIIKSIRDRNGVVKFVSSVEECDSETADKFSSLWELYLSESDSFSRCTVKANIEDTLCYFKIETCGGDLFLAEPSNATVINEDLGGGLSRQITFEDTSSSWSSEKTITVKVKWKDSSGEHESNLQTILTKL